eukprot:TRINITY_DN400_c0_g1_i1.p1 TRINITY_DN400_c0_g1~~TRINITY_DN400_c0_g1_i1.p1  ORF type:complete len:153 (+),score=41.86 TRINITY_DN400_c0_g1_i1:78-536(+)
MSLQEEEDFFSDEEDRLREEEEDRLEEEEERQKKMDTVRDKVRGLYKEAQDKKDSKKIIVLDSSGPSKRASTGSIGFPARTTMTGGSSTSTTRTSRKPSPATSMTSASLNAGSAGRRPASSAGSSPAASSSKDRLLKKIQKQKREKQGTRTK